MWASGQLWKAGPLQSLEHRFPAEEYADASRLLGRPPDVGNTQIHISVMKFHINMMLNRDSYACRRWSWGSSERGHQWKWKPRDWNSSRLAGDCRVALAVGEAPPASACISLSSSPVPPSLLFLIEFDALWKLQRHKNNTLLHPSPRDLKALYGH